MQPGMGGWGILGGDLGFLGVGYLENGEKLRRELDDIELEALDDVLDDMKGEDLAFNKLFNGNLPTSKAVIQLADIDLQKVGLSKQKVAYLKDLSFHFHDKVFRSQRLYYMDNEEVIRKLTGIHGIGRWTAEMFLIFSLNRPDVLPVSDLGLQLALQKLYRMRQLPTVKRMRTLGRKWNPLETVATWYAWRTQDGKNIAY